MRTTPWDPQERGLEPRICVRCVMDTSDPDITFDEDGVCSHCRYFETGVRPYWKPNAEGARELEALLAEVREAGRGRRYDCILGVSGGVDSSYLVVKAVEWGLRPLLVHVDAGWNSELAVRNIELLVSRLNLGLVTEVIDWEEMRDLQVAFLRSHVVNQDIPQDHAFAGALMRCAVKHRIRYIFSGTNLATEAILPASWGRDAMDLTHIRAIHDRFGKRPLRSFPTVSFFDLQILHPALKMKVVAPLNFIPYGKVEAMKLLETEYGWRYYGGKHYESRWTRWYQAHYLPRKFGYDKRKAHLASLIVSGQMSRQDALRELEKPLYTGNELAEDTAFIAKKLGMSVEELTALMDAPPIAHEAYPTNEFQLAAWRRLGERWNAVRQGLELARHVILYAARNPARAAAKVIRKSAALAGRLARR